MSTQAQADFRILVVDDNPAIHQDFIKILTANSTTSEFDQLSEKIFGESSNEIKMPTLEIDTASQGQEAVKMVEESLQVKKPYALAFVDIRMPPGWDGIETIKHIWELDKNMQIVICTAHSDYSWEETVSNLGQTDNLLILKKPFDNVAVRQLACALTKKWILLQEQQEYASTLEKRVYDRTTSLQKSLSMVKATLESSNDGILVFDKTGNISDFNQKFTMMWKTPFTIIESKNVKQLLEHMCGQLLNPDETMNEFNWLIKDNESTRINLLKFKDGNIFEYYSQPQKMNGNTIGRIFDFRDITKQAKLEQKLQYQAMHDYLTGLPNRVFLIERLSDSIRKAELNHNHFALLFIDLDRFKLINDSLSHSVGDVLLQTVADRLQEAISQDDLLARLGGDEFVILLSNITNEEQVVKIAHKILDAFLLPFKIEDREITMTISIGISIFPKDGKTIDTLLRNADTAMYHAKDLKGGTFQLYMSEMGDQNLAKFDKEIELRHAIENNEFFVCYQPQFNLTTEKLVAVEALIRWKHPKKGVLLPADFIPLAEETGLISTIGEWVMRTACKQAKEWEKLAKTPIRVAVNVTAEQIKQENLVDIVKKTLRDTKLKPEYLELELTENIIISNMDVIKTINELKKLGITIAIDDFGTGYTSLGYLKSISLDRLKIDKSFIQHIRNEDDDEVIIRAIIAIAKNLHMQVLAEGVETKHQLNFLKKHECGDVQGFYFSKPLTVDELEKLLTLSSSMPLSKILD